jgi:hypothetical protein
MADLGTVWVDDFDRGVVVSLGGGIETYAIGGDTRQAYAVTVPGLTTDYADIGNKVPIMFTTPEAEYQPFTIPCFVVKRNDLSPAFDRQAWYGIVQKEPAADAVLTTITKYIENGIPVTQSGYSEYVSRWRAMPFDIGYDVEVMGRGHIDGLKMLNHAMKMFAPPWFNISVVDSAGDTRLYDAGEVSVSNSSELADIADRTIGWTISFTLRAELDLNVDFSTRAVTSLPDMTYSRMITL